LRDFSSSTLTARDRDRLGTRKLMGKPQSVGAALNHHWASRTLFSCRLGFEYATEARRNYCFLNCAPSALKALSENQCQCAEGRTGGEANASVPRWSLQWCPTCFHKTSARFCSPEIVQEIAGPEIRMHRNTFIIPKLLALAIGLFLSNIPQASKAYNFDLSGPKPGHPSGRAGGRTGDSADGRAGGRMCKCGLRNHTPRIRGGRLFAVSSDSQRRALRVSSRAQTY